MKKLLVIGKTWPEPASSAAGSRMLQLLNLFLARDWEITYASPATKSKFTIDFQAKGIVPKKIKTNDQSFDAFLKKMNPKVVIFDRFMMEEQFGWRVAECCPNALRILDTEDLHFFREARYKAFKKGRNLRKSDLQSDEARREIASILRSDLSLIISEAEQELLIEKFKINPGILTYIPFLLRSITAEEMEALPTFSERQDFLFIGNFYHQPNWDAVLYLKEKIWPLIRQQLPKAQLQIYGAYTPEKVRQLHQPKNGFLINGRAPKSSEVFKKARVLLAPLRFGAGIKGKFVEAMLHGTPSVTTIIGAEGIGGPFPWNGEIANNDQAIADGAVHLYQKPKRWKKAQENGFRIIEKRFQHRNFADAFFEKVTAINEHLEFYRSKNFMGSLLRQHNLQSTKYMSKWIEAKNELQKLKGESKG